MMLLMHIRLLLWSLRQQTDREHPSLYASKPLVLLFFQSMDWKEKRNRGNGEASVQPVQWRLGRSQASTPFDKRGAIFGILPQASRYLGPVLMGTNL